MNNKELAKKIVEAVNNETSNFDAIDRVEEILNTVIRIKESAEVEPDTDGIWVIYEAGTMEYRQVGTATTERDATIIGELDGRITERVTRIAETFRRAGLAITVSDNIVGTMWDKLVINVATGALAGITKLPYGGLYAVPEIEACALAAVAEGIAVARAAGVRLSYDEPAGPWRKAAEGLPAEFKTSILQSLEKGQKSEVGFINGAVVRWVAKVGVPTPINQALVACVKGIERWMESYAPRIA